ncbi:MAG TPA: hypothetical protein DCW45_09255, partial [Opitutae bacterium]|nr:hypothetical protein [Opitutae bacterium]
VSYYRVLSFPALLVFGVFLFLSFFSKEKVFIKPNLPISLLLLGASPMIIIALLTFSIGEGFYYRYFIPAQIGIVAFAIWFIFLIRPLTFSRKLTTSLFTLSSILIFAWSIRNFANKEKHSKKIIPVPWNLIIPKLKIRESLFSQVI